MLGTCPHCTYISQRKDNMVRHIRVKHGSKTIVSSVVDELLCDVIASSTEETEEVAVEVVAVVEESAYLRMRNERVATIQAEFQRLYPQFEEEVQDMRLVSKGKNKKRIKTIGTATRRSSRVQPERIRICGEQSLVSHAEGDTVANHGEDLVPGRHGLGTSSVEELAVIPTIDEVVDNSD